jgi:hypothetical protein
MMNASTDTLLLLLTLAYLLATATRSASHRASRRTLFAPLPVARHQHRQAWSRRVWPWTGCIAFCTILVPTIAWRIPSCKPLSKKSVMPMAKSRPSAFTKSSRKAGEGTRDDAADRDAIASTQDQETTLQIERLDHLQE